jgi:hypothetical protein
MIFSQVAAHLFGALSSRASNVQAEDRLGVEGRHVKAPVRVSTE